MKQLYHGYLRLLNAQETGETMALFRITVGVIVGLGLIALSVLGVDEMIWVRDSEGGYRSLGKGPWLVALLGGPSLSTTTLLMCAGIVSSALLVVGLGGRVTAFVVLQLYIAVTRINNETSGSSDILITNALWLLVLARSTATWSIDCRLRNGSWSSREKISSIPRGLAIFQMVILYCTTGIQKISVYWLPAGGYSALFFVLQQPSWVRFRGDWLKHVYPVTQFLTALSWTWEVTSFVLLIFFYLRMTRRKGGRLRRVARRFDVRIPFAVVGLGFHIGILILMVVGSFSPIAMAYYWNLFSPREYRALFRRVRWWRRRRSL